MSSLPPQHIANYICGIQTIGHRVIVSDVQESFIWVRYKRNENQLIIFADDTYPRWVTTATLLDYDTVAGADKFGNICVVSVPRRGWGFLNTDVFFLKTPMICLKGMRICAQLEATPCAIPLFFTGRWLSSRRPAAVYQFKLKQTS